MKTYVIGGPRIIDFFNVMEKKAGENGKIAVFASNIDLNYHRTRVLFAGYFSILVPELYVNSRAKMGGKHWAIMPGKHRAAMCGNHRATMTGKVYPGQ